MFGRSPVYTCQSIRFQETDACTGKRKYCVLSFTSLDFTVLSSQGFSVRCVDPFYFFKNVIRTSFIIPQKSHDPSQLFNVDMANMKTSCSAIMDMNNRNNKS